MDGKVLLLCSDTDLRGQLQGALTGYNLVVESKLPEALDCDLLIAEEQLLPEEPLNVPVLALCKSVPKYSWTDDFLRCPFSEWELLSRILRLERDQDWLEAAASDLKRAHSALEQQETDYRAYLRRLAHDLRNPLNGIVGFAKLLRRKAKDQLDDKNQGFINQILDSSQTLERMLVDAVTAEEFDFKASFIRLEAVETDTVIHRFLATRDHSVAFKSVIPLLRIDPRRLNALLTMLMDLLIESDVNAVPELVVGEGEHSVDICLGFGLSGAHWEEWSAHTPRRQVMGQLAGLLGAQLYQDRRTRNLKLELPPSVKMIPASIEPVGEGPDILVVDDEVSVLESLQGLLSDSGFRVHAANLGETGWDKALDLRPAVIITDFSMPDLQGDRLVERLREEPATRDIPVIIWSGTCDPRQLDGVAAWLSKPFDLDKVISTVRRLVGGTQQGDENAPAGENEP